MWDYYVFLSESHVPLGPLGPLQTLLGLHSPRSLAPVMYATEADGARPLAVVVGRPEVNKDTNE